MTKERKKKTEHFNAVSSGLHDVSWKKTRLSYHTALFHYASEVARQLIAIVLEFTHFRLFQRVCKQHQVTNCFRDSATVEHDARRKKMGGKNARQGLLI